MNAKIMRCRDGMGKLKPFVSVSLAMPPRGCLGERRLREDGMEVRGNEHKREMRKSQREE